MSADVFLSYSRDDLSTARRFAEAFERAGLSVWWDQTLEPGDAFDHLTEKALRESRAVVVLWSKKSVASRWVRAEATLAERSKTLVPVMIEPCDRPIMFELTQTSDLTQWKGADSDHSWQRFLASVRRMAEREASPTNVQAPTSAQPAHAPPPRQGRIAVAVLALLAGLVASGIYLSKRAQPTVRTTAQTGAASTMQAKPRIAIMPFENLSPDPANAFFADGLHEEILSALSNSTAGLEVISRTTMMTYRAAPKSVAEIAHELGASYVMEGSVRRDGNDVRLTLQLIDAKTDGHVWAQNFDRKLVRAMMLQSEVAAAVASQLAVKLSTPGGVAAAAPTRDPEAYDLYLQARLASRQFSGGTSPEEFSRIADLYGAAIARDPDFGLAYLGRVATGPTHLERPGGMGAWLQQTQHDLAEARRLLGNDARIALFEAINTAEGLYADIPKILALFGMAEAQGLNDPDILVTKTDVLVAAGRIDDAVGLSRQLVSLDPANPRLLVPWASVLFLARKPGESIQTINRIIDQVPQDNRAMWREVRDDVRFAYTGFSKSDVSPATEEAPPGIDAGFLQGVRLHKLRYQRQYSEVLQLLGHVPGPMLTSDGVFEELNLNLPPPPVARIRGWTRLLQGQRDAARSDGREVLRLLGRSSSASDKEFAWLTRLRMAEGHLFAKEPEEAVTAAREGLALMPHSRNALLWDYASAMGAAILAWAGQKDEAASLLEDLAISVPGLAPASITRDPIYADALANNARFKALSERLEAQMAATKLP